MQVVFLHEAICVFLWLSSDGVQLHPLPLELLVESIELCEVALRVRSEGGGGVKGGGEMDKG